MKVTFDYYRRIEEEVNAYFNKFKNRNRHQVFKHFKPDKILFEKRLSSLDYLPNLGRYDTFFHPFIEGKLYTPGKLSKKRPKNYSTYVYYYKNRKPCFVLHGFNPEYYTKGRSESDYLLKCIEPTVYFIVDEGYFGFHSETNEFIMGYLNSHDEKNNYYLSFSGVNKPLSCRVMEFEQTIVSKETKKVDQYIKNGRTYYHQSFDKDALNLDCPIDSKFIDTSNSLVKELSCVISKDNFIKEGYQPVAKDKFKRED